MRWKWMIGSIVLIVVALIAGAFIFPAAYNYNRLKPQITRMVFEKTGRKLTLGGNIRFRLGFSPTLVLNDIDFQNAAWASQPEMVKAKRLEVQVALTPPHFRPSGCKATVTGPPRYIEKNNAGQLNLAFKSSENVRTPESATPTPPVIIHEMRVDNGRITYTDRRSGYTEEVRVDSLTVHSAGPEKNFGVKS